MTLIELAVERFKCVIVKELIQRLSGVESIGISSREQNLVEFRSFYCKICRTETKASLKDIASVLRFDYDHATVLHSIKTFDNFRESGQLIHEEIFNEAKQITKEKFNDKFINSKIQVLIDSELNNRIVLISKYYEFVQDYKTEFNELLCQDYQI